jgi:hypothetical protein
MRKTDSYIHGTNCSLAFWMLLPSLRKLEDQLRRKKHDLRTRVAKCTEVDDGVFENVLQTVTVVSFLCNILSFKHAIKIKTLAVSNLTV